MQLAEDGEKFLGGQPRCARIFQSITAESILALVRSTKAAYRPVLFSAFLLYLPQHEDHVYGPSVGPETTLSFWRVFLCCHRDEPIQQDTSQDSAGNGEQSDALEVWTVWFSPSFLSRETMTASLRSCGRVPFSQQLVNRSWSLSSTASPPCWLTSAGMP